MADSPENQSSTVEQKEHQSSSSSSSSAYPETEKLKKPIEEPFGGFHPADGDIKMIPSMSTGIFQGAFGAFRLANGDIQMIPIMSPGIFQPQLNQEQVNHGRGIYAVGTDSLIPFTYSLPTQTASDSRPVVGGDQGQLDPQQQQQQQQPHQQNAGAQRQVVVRRFQIAFQLDLLLILKLAAVIFLFNPDGSRQRLVLLVFFAVIVYLYQTGALAPLVRWLSQGMQRAAMPPPRQPPPRPAVRADDNDHNAAGRAGNDNAAVAADGQPGAEAAADGGDRAVENEGLAEPGGAPPEGGGNRWWGIVKEIQIIVFGFITSLLPGFHNIEQ